MRSTQKNGIDAVKVRDDAQALSRLLGPYDPENRKVLMELAALYLPEPGLDAEPSTGVEERQLPLLSAMALKRFRALEGPEQVLLAVGISGAARMGAKFKSIEISRTISENVGAALSNTAATMDLLISRQWIEECQEEKGEGPLSSRPHRLFRLTGMGACELKALCYKAQLYEKLDENLDAE